MEIQQTVGAVVALKDTEFAKSRLSPLPPALRRELAWCMAVDTLRALAPVVDRVIVVSNDGSLVEKLTLAGVSAEVIPDPPTTGINAALRHGAALLSSGGASVVMAVVGDLPALTPASVRRILAASQDHQRSFVPDSSGIGTTMLISRGVDLDPRFQGRSAAAHRTSGAVGLRFDPPVTDAQLDVDTEVDLATARHLRLGPATSALFDPQTGRLASKIN